MWREQWERVQRSYKWVEIYTQTSTPGVPGESTEDRKDRVTSFFLHCYHLKDWLKNDPTSTVRASDVEAELSANSIMQIVGDIANGAKHLDLTAGRYPPKTGDATTAMTRQDVSITIGGGTSIKMYVDSNGTEHDAYDLAKLSIAWWNAYLTTRKLLP